MARKSAVATQNNTSVVNTNNTQSETPNPEIRRTEDGKITVPFISPKTGMIAKEVVIDLTNLNHKKIHNAMILADETTGKLYRRSRYDGQTMHRVDELQIRVLAEANGHPVYPQRENGKLTTRGLLGEIIFLAQDRDFGPTDAVVDQTFGTCRMIMLYSKALAAIGVGLPIKPETLAAFIIGTPENEYLPLKDRLIKRQGNLRSDILKHIEKLPTEPVADETEAEDLF